MCQIRLSTKILRFTNLTLLRQSKMYFCNSEDKGNKENNGKPNDFPEEPTTCCMSGCANCVWLEYAEKLSEYYKDGGEKAIKEIKEKVTDHNIKAFLLHELRMRKRKE